ncbi:putative glycerol kinase 5 isoform X2 [Chrysoperla carnea]|uniref:putative glycerol kinase 5 isoform X2 n=1 Tax=Chrysoperla carnea TaxID=189513 RepID=UPI001D069964|nr:putative glycerol kinase 5 isoform X2 [Chrysoperla carnea]
MEELYIAALDIGTTSIRCHIVNRQCVTVGIASNKIQLVYPEPGHVEIEPDTLWLSIKSVIYNAIANAHLTAGQISCLGITTQRATFITWDQLTGEPFHNFITWKDIRANSLVQMWNKSFTMKTIRTASYIMYLITKNRRYLAASVINFSCAQVTLRLLWVIQHCVKLKEAISKNRAMFGTIDSWLIYKLTNGRVHVTDISNASATGMYDPFLCSWSDLMNNVFKIPQSILPKVVDNVAKEFGSTHSKIFGVEIPIVCSIADQSASVFASGCYETGNLKMTLGTGSFLDIVTGSIPYASVCGVYPLIGWKVGKELLYLVEGATNDTGTIIEWALKVELLTNPMESSELAYKAGSSDGIYFIPAFSGLGPPINDLEAASGFIGIKPTTTKECMVRAVLESIVFRLVQLLQVVIEEIDITPTVLRFLENQE